MHRIGTTGPTSETARIRVRSTARTVSGHGGQEQHYESNAVPCHPARVWLPPGGLASAHGARPDEPASSPGLAAPGPFRFLPSAYVAAGSSGRIAPVVVGVVDVDVVR